MIDKKQLIEELLECVKDATNTETQITGLSMCAMLMNEVLDEALTIPVVIICDSCKFKGCHNLYDSPCDSLNECENTCGNYNEC